MVIFAHLLPKELGLMCEAALLLHPTPVPLQLFNPLLLLFCGLQLSLLQQPVRLIVQRTHIRDTFYIFK